MSASKLAKFRKYKRKRFNINTLIFLMFFFFMMGLVVFPYFNLHHYDENNPPPHFPIPIGKHANSDTPYIVQYHEFKKHYRVSDLWQRNAQFPHEHLGGEIKQRTRTLYEMAFKSEIFTITYRYKIDEKNDKVIPLSQRTTGWIIWIYALASLLGATVLLVVGQWLHSWWKASFTQKSFQSHTKQKQAPSSSKKSKSLKINTLTFLFIFFLAMGFGILPHFYTQYFDEQHRPQQAFFVAAKLYDSQDEPLVINIQYDGIHPEELWLKNIEFPHNAAHAQVKKINDAVYELHFKKHISTITYRYRIDKINYKIIPEMHKISGLLLWFHALGYLMVAAVLITAGQWLYFRWKTSPTLK